MPRRGSRTQLVQLLLAMLRRLPASRAGACTGADLRQVRLAENWSTHTASRNAISAKDLRGYTLDELRMVVLAFGLKPRAVGRPQGSKLFSPYAVLSVEVDRAKAGNKRLSEASACTHVARKAQVPAEGLRRYRARQRSVRKTQI